MATYTLDIDNPEKSRLVRRLLKQWGYEEVSPNYFADKDSPRARAAGAERQTPKDPRKE